ncbi:DUF2459 domain-containing protein [Novosphingobium tardum]|uniref:DUF2459 domain-containing protein n=1 Tax=Novosphingobium tardum TaxID=1538021 RepID=A0ABV8RQW2_9SPHN
MAPATRRPLIRRAERVLALLALAIALYPLAGWIGSSLPAARRALPPASADAVEIMVERNPIHTGIVVPLVSDDMDWRPVFPASDLRDPDRPYTHLAIAWGERRLFLETPTWADLRFATVLNIVAGGGRGLLHVAHYVRPAPGEDMRPLRITRAQYRILVRHILAMRGEGGRKYPGYGNDDAFYDARGHYTLLRTCNTWTGKTLAAAGVPMGRWTPFAGGVMKWIDEPAPSPAPEPVAGSAVP